MRRQRERLLAVATVLLLGGGVGAIALAQQSDEPPSIALDGGGPLFELQGMQPGDQPTERCIALSARGGTATRLEVSATVSGSLARKLRMEVQGGSSPGPGASRSCDGFAAAQTLWSGTLADFPAAGAPAVSDGALADGASRAFRFRVWLPADADVRPNETASQTITWRASLDAPPKPTTSTPAPTSPAPTTPEPAPTTAAPPPTGGQSLEQPRRACRGTIRCRGRLIARLTPRAARLHLRVHAPGRARIRALTLVLPASLPAARTRIEVTRATARGGVLRLTGRVRLRDRADRRLLTLRRLPPRTRTVLLQVRVPSRPRPALVRAACRRAPVTARLRTSAGRAVLRQRLWIAPGRCRVR